MKLLVRLVVGTALVVAAAVVLMPLSICACVTKRFTYRTAIKSDLRTLSSAQEAYRGTHGSFAADLTRLALRPTQGVRVRVVVASREGFLAEATHELWAEGRCVIGGGSFLGDSLKVGEPLCHGAVR